LELKHKMAGLLNLMGYVEGCLSLTLPIITLLSDFGLKDPYVAEMKAVILGICSDARIVDISHSVPKFDVRMGAFTLASAAPYFPNGAIHVAVVDPSVGTTRRALIVKTERYFYVGPDNGLLMLAAEKDGIVQVHAIENPEFMLGNVSSTFHGRDVFAPAAAHLANRVLFREFGPEVKDYERLLFSKPSLNAGKELRGEVLHIDDFGNLITNVSSSDLAKLGIKITRLLNIRLKDTLLHLQLYKTYGEAPLRSALAIIGSHDLLEISVNQGSASRKLKAKVGDSLIVSQA
jgi:S-adenosyl-L-methionine hydrolase (adenosine-forming)